MLEKYREYNQDDATRRDVHRILIEFNRSHDSVSRRKLWNAMVKLDIPKTLVALTQMYVAKVKFCVNSALKQGDPLSPLII